MKKICIRLTSKHTVVIIKVFGSFLFEIILKYFFYIYGDLGDVLWKAMSKNSHQVNLGGGGLTSMYRLSIFITFRRTQAYCQHTIDIITLIYFTNNIVVKSSSSLSG